MRIFSWQLFEYTPWMWAKRWHASLDFMKTSAGGVWEWLTFPGDWVNPGKIGLHFWCLEYPGIIFSSHFPSSKKTSSPQQSAGMMTTWEMIVCFTKHPLKHGCLVYQEGMSISYITYRFESTKDSQFFRLHLASRKKLPYFTNLPVFPETAGVPFPLQSPPFWGRNRSWVMRSLNDHILRIH